MTRHTDDDMDDALRTWGDAARRGTRDPGDTAPPSIADLLAERRRRRTLGAVAASVVLVVALAVGLGLGIRPHGAPSAEKSGHRSTPTTQQTRTATGRPCWQQFAVSDSALSPVPARAIAVLRYTGNTACRITDSPQLAFLDARGRVTGPDAAPGTLTRFVTIHPGETVRATFAIEFCAIPEDGRFSLLVRFRPTGRPRPAGGIVVPLGSLRAIGGGPGCSVSGQASIADTTSFQVVSQRRESTLAHLTRIARREAMSDNDPSATAEAVRTTYGQAEDTLLDSTVSGGRDNTVWVVQLRGKFTCGMCKVPPGASAPHGTTVVLVLQEPGLRLSDSSVEKQHYNLAGLGTVVPLIP